MISKDMRVPFVLLLFVLIFLPCTVDSRVLCMEEERNSLLDFKLSFTADPYSFLSTWSINNTECCKWLGVDCDDHTGHVVSLQLRYMLVSHQLRPSLLRLHQLSFFDIRYNNFSMRIPQFIGSLTTLTSLLLDHSGFFGMIPPHFQNLTKLETLSVGGNAGLHANNLQWLSHLNALKELDLSFINLSMAALEPLSSSLLNLTGLSISGTLIHKLPNLSKMSSLSYFQASHNNMNGDLPLILQHLPKNISSLDLSYNSLYCIFSNCSLPYFWNLTKLDISHNLIHKLPDLSKLSSLSYFDASSNNMSGDLYSLLQHLPASISSLDLSHNSLYNIVSNFSLPIFFNLTYLEISYNLINTLPDFSKLAHLNELDASHNRISEVEIFSKLPVSMSYLDLSLNSLNGVISDAHFSRLSNLSNLYLAQNYHLRFNFSENWVPPFKLEDLNVRSCIVGPHFPNWILTQKSLEILDISNSSIFGVLPNSIWYPDVLGYLYFNVSHNKLQGTIPDIFLNFDVMDLSFNDFHGRIPTQFFFTSRRQMDFSNNKFSSFSSLSKEISSHHHIMQINLSNNRLLGSPPDRIFQLPSLVILNLANNMLSGTLSSNITSLRNLNTLHLNNNRFHGKLPSSLKNCTQLMILELQDNFFSGSLPFWIGDSLSRLIFLNFRSNNFSGDLPSNLCHLQNLQVLDLSSNRISGSILGCVHNFTSMAKYQGFEGFPLSYDISQGALSYKEPIDGEGYLDYASIMWKGILANESGQNLPQWNVIDLSHNCLTGNIPSGVTSLKYLRSLNLSRNNLNGSIPNEIGQLTFMEVLGLSSNNLSGQIPKSLDELTFLNKLNLSSNNLSGRIPSSTQLQSFDPSSFAENPKLCGEPLPIKCYGDNVIQKQPPLVEEEANYEAFEWEAFYAALGLGFTFGLLGILGIMNFHARSRHAFFWMSDRVGNRIFVYTSLY